jgi:type IV pilus assembly protein PilA
VPLLGSVAFSTAVLRHSLVASGNATPPARRTTRSAPPSFHEKRRVRAQPAPIAAFRDRGTTLAPVASQQPHHAGDGESLRAALIAVRRRAKETGRKKMRNEKGFTLIELLVVVAIIGILAAIAIPQFSEYRKQGFNARASSDLRNLATAEEAYFAANATYAADFNSLPGFKQSPGVSISIQPGTNSFTASASHQAGDKTFQWDSANGGLQNAP